MGAAGNDSSSPPPRRLHTGSKWINRDAAIAARSSSVAPASDAIAKKKYDWHMSIGYRCVHLSSKGDLDSYKGHHFKMSLKPLIWLIMKNLLTWWHRWPGPLLSELSRVLLWSVEPVVLLLPVWKCVSCAWFCVCTPRPFVFVFLSPTVDQKSWIKSELTWINHLTRSKIWILKSKKKEIPSATAAQCCSIALKLTLGNLPTIPGISTYVMGDVSHLNRRCLVS